MGRRESHNGPLRFERVTATQINAHGWESNRMADVCLCAPVHALYVWRIAGGVVYFIHTVGGVKERIECGGGGTIMKMVITSCSPFTVTDRLGFDEAQG